MKIRSMTGFGHAESDKNKRKFTVEIKAVNHRFLEVGIRSPKLFNIFESSIRSTIKEYLSRGKVDVFITYNSLRSSGYTVKYDKDVASQYVDHLKQIEEDFGLKEDILPTTIARFPDVLTVEEEFFVEDEEYAVIEKVLDEAGMQFMESRAKEGANLSRDLRSKMDELEELTSAVDELAPKMVEEFREKLTGKVEKLLETADIDEARIVQEVTIYSDKVAVDEELVRLHSHIAAVRDMLADAEGESLAPKESEDDKNSSIGRRLDFIVQEMNREANTTLSKSDTIAVTDIGINMKTCIEKVREQVQNLE
mgnify:CR=1 FL=1